MVEKIENLEAFQEIYDSTTNTFKGQTDVTIGQVFDNEEFIDNYLDTFHDNVISVMDLGLNITHLHEMVQLIGETPYAGQLSKFYFESEVNSPLIPMTIGEE